MESDSITVDNSLQNDPDVYLMINKIQNDIAQHEALVARIQRRDAEYDVMKKAYEQKLTVLQSQMSQFQIERDLALSKMQAGGSKNRAKSKYEESPLLKIRILFVASFENDVPLLNTNPSVFVLILLI